jgi:hypothetical protein
MAAQKQYATMKQIFLLAILLLCPPGWSDDQLAIPSDQTTLQEMREVLRDKSDFVDRKAKRLGNKVLQVDCFLSIAGDFETFKKVSSHLPGWRDWALIDINLPLPGQSEYILQLHDLLENTPSVMTSVFSFNIPFFKNHRSRSFNTTTTLNDKALLIVGETLPAEKSAVKRAKAFMKAFPGENKTSHIWVNVKAMVEFNSWFFYEALPEKVLLREVGDRLTYLAQNYQREESRRRTNTMLTTTPAPKLEVPNENQ